MNVTDDGRVLTRYRSSEGISFLSVFKPEVGHRSLGVRSWSGALWRNKLAYSTDPYTNPGDPYFGQSAIVILDIDSGSTWNEHAPWGGGPAWVQGYSRNGSLIYSSGASDITDYIRHANGGLAEYWQHHAGDVIRSVSGSGFVLASWWTDSGPSHPYDPTPLHGSYIDQIYPHGRFRILDMPWPQASPLLLTADDKAIWRSLNGLRRENIVGSGGTTSYEVAAGVRQLLSFTANEEFTYLDGASRLMVYTPTLGHRTLQEVVTGVDMTQVQSARFAENGFLQLELQGYRSQYLEPVPEPATLTALGLGLFALGKTRRKLGKESS